jgi:predicted secreted protein
VLKSKTLAIGIFLTILIGIIITNKQSKSLWKATTREKTNFKKVHIKPEDQQKEIILSVGQDFIVSVPTNPTTGTNTYYVASGEEPWFLVNKTFNTDPENKDLAGTGGEAIFTFRTIRSGAASLILFESRMEDPSETLKQATTTTYQIEVK